MGSRIYPPSHCGMGCSAIHHNIITRTHSELDLTNQQVVNNFFETERPEYVFLAAAKVGGIPEQIEDGITGFPPHPGDEEAMAARLVQLFEDDRLKHKMINTTAEHA